jgi:formamidopyrimidine-DNA glycosylase
VPELPEVETARRYLERWARGRRVKAVLVHDRRVVTGGGPRSLQALVGARFATFDRRGKHLLLTLNKAKAALGLWSHLGMSGKWLLRQPGEEAPRFSRVELALEGARGAHLHFVDMRLFGKLRLVPKAAFDKQPVLAGLGPDPLHDGIDVDRLGQRLARRGLPIKPLLLDQTLLAGVGNIQASEALFRAGIDPRRRARDVSPAEVKALARAIKASIAFTLARFEKEIAAQHGRDIRYVEEPSSFNPFKVYDRAGERCRQCRKGTIQPLVQAGRSTFYCDRHQR